MSERGRVLVTGGAGYIGSHVCKRLAAAGFLPVAYDDLSRGHAWAVKWGPLVQAGLQDVAALRAALDEHRPVAAMHLAAFTYAGESVAEPTLYWRNNVGGTACLLQGLRDHGLARVVFSSTSSLYGDVERLPIDESCPAQPGNPYAHTKLAAERMLADCEQAFGLRHVALRYFNATGADPDGEIGEAHDPEPHLVPVVLEVAAGLRDKLTIYGEDYPTPDGTCVRDYVHVADVAEAHLLALDRLLGGGASLMANLGNGTGFSVRQIAAAVERVTGRQVVTATGPRRAGDVPALVADIGRARSELGWSPARVALDGQIADSWRWLLAWKRLRP